MKIRTKLYLPAILVFALLMLLYGLVLAMIGQQDQRVAHAMDATHIILESLGVKGAAQSYLITRSPEYLARVRDGIERILQLARETSQHMHRTEDHARMEQIIAAAEEYREIIEEHIRLVDQAANFEAQLAQNGRALEASIWYAQDFIEQRLLRLDPLQTASGEIVGNLKISKDLHWMRHYAADVRGAEKELVRRHSLHRGSVEAVRADLMAIQDLATGLKTRLPAGHEQRHLAGVSTAARVYHDTFQRYVETITGLDDLEQRCLAAVRDLEVAAHEMRAELLDQLQLLREHMAGIIFTVFVLVGGIVLLICLFIARDIFHSLRILQQGIAGIAAGRLDIGLPSMGEDELGELGRGFQHMAEQLNLRTRELERSNAELSQFAYVASHDLHEPLRKIKTFAEMLADRISPVADEETRSLLEKIQSAAARMQQLIRDLLALSRIATRGDNFRPTDLTQVAREVMIDLEIQQRDTLAQIKLGELPVIEADSTQMRQLFQNLIGNALKFCRPGIKPQIVISGRVLPADASTAVPMCEIRISDNGAGFDEQHLERIFLPFQRLHGRGDDSGSGMGLAICKKIVERHGGSITAQGRVGEGSTFIVTLPVCGRQPSSMTPPGVARAPSEPGPDRGETIH